MFDDPVEAKIRRERKWAVRAGIAVAVLVVAGLAYSSSAADDEDTPGESIGEARAGCEEFVERRLKAPATADFSGWSEFGGSTGWTVSGAVDAENSFGAKLRMPFTCKMHAEGERWVLDSLTGLG